MEIGPHLHPRVSCTAIPNTLFSQSFTGRKRTTYPMRIAAFRLGSRFFGSPFPSDSCAFSEFSAWVERLVPSFGPQTLLLRLSLLSPSLTRPPRPRRLPLPPLPPRFPTSPLSFFPSLVSVSFVTAVLSRLVEFTSYPFASTSMASFLVAGGPPGDPGRFDDSPLCSATGVSPEAGMAVEVEGGDGVMMRRGTMGRNIRRKNDLGWYQARRYAVYRIYRLSRTDENQNSEMSDRKQVSHGCHIKCTFKNLQAAYSWSKSMTPTTPNNPEGSQIDFNCPQNDRVQSLLALLTPRSRYLTGLFLWRLEETRDGRLLQSQPDQAHRQKYNGHKSLTADH